ncbi:PREDICTED: NACHT, LRR and PYD domains-containing protein 9-like [Elephantulus edwardii]|uniref:NACHT, LRR and PYD domains-containing protein 9-like n=1 Tax=Elephantulus edwardii TaxID=28737 RepID=UPI0003F0C6A8|nr:PREDICTED: NACHT, LRR and PYD domains-containing protein 9-like [Elephantulus edwardii]
MAESFFSDFGLLWYLEELKKDEFWKFKELLKQEPLKHELKSIPWTELKRASREDLVKLLGKFYTEKQVWEVTLSIFQQLQRTDLWKKAQKEIKCNLNPYKKHMRKKFQLIWENEVCLPVPDAFYEETIKKASEELRKVYSLNETQGEPVTVLLRGSEGTGKSTFLRKTMLEWTEGSFCKDRFTFVFFFSGRELNAVAETSLVELFSRDWPETSESIDNILSQPQEILFILDDLEELNCDLTGDFTCDDWTQPLPVDILLSSLLQKKLLPGASLLIALEPDNVKRHGFLLQHPKSLFVSSLTIFDIKKYFSYFFPETKKAGAAFDFVKGNRALLALCQNPLLCQLICSCLKWQLARGEDLHITYQRRTALFATFFINTVKAGSKTFSQKRNILQVKGLCRLAAEGVWTQNTRFSLKDFRRHGVPESFVLAWSGVSLLRRNGDCITFIHRKIQDFCAALFYLLKEPSDSYNPAIGCINKLIFTGLWRVESNLIQTRLFVFGLSAEKINNILGMSANVQLSQEIMRCIKSLQRYKFAEEELDFQELFNGLFETQEKGFVMQAMDIFGEIAIHIEYTVELMIASYCLPHCQNLQKLTLCLENVFSDTAGSCESSMTDRITLWGNLCLVFRYNKNLKAFELINTCLNNDSLAILSRAMAPPFSDLQRIVFYFVSGLGDGADFFKTILHHPSLKYLSLHGTRLCHAAVRQLCETLKQPKCNIEQLMLGNCNITQDACEDLVAALICNNKLKHLSLLENPLNDEGIRLLCNGLKHPECALEILLLNYCCLSYIPCGYISEALLQSKSLTFLSLSFNVLLDRGVATLCEALKSPDCQLQELWLKNCFLSSECCKSISAVLINNQNLKTLNLGQNKILDAGVIQLCDALKHPNCNLQKLGLERCGLTSACSEDLASALTTCMTLKHLTLDWINLDHDGVTVLCRALNHPNCTLEVLGLNKDEFDEESRLLLKDSEEKNAGLTITHQPWIEKENKLSGMVLD